MWLIYALLAAAITGVGQVFVKKGQITLTPLLDNFLATIIIIFILVPLLLIFGVDLNAGKNIWIYALITAFMYATFYYIISKGNVSLMISLINAFPIVTIALSIIILRQYPNEYQWIGIFFLITAMYCITKEKSISKKSLYKNKRWVIWGLLGALAIGIAEFITEVATLQTDGFTYTFYVYLMYVPPLIFLMLVDKKGRKFSKLKNKNGLLYTVVGIFFIELGLLGIALAYQYGLASLVAPVVSTHILVTAVLASIFLREKLIRIQKIGILLTIIGVSIIGIFS